MLSRFHGPFLAASRLFGLHAKEETPVCEKGLKYQEPPKYWYFPGIQSGDQGIRVLGIVCYQGDLESLLFSVPSTVFWVLNALAVGLNGGFIYA